MNSVSGEQKNKPVRNGMREVLINILTVYSEASQLSLTTLLSVGRSK